MVVEGNRSTPLRYDRAELGRFAPSRLGIEPLPPYAYIPGRGPHPIRSPDGHMHGISCEEPAALTEAGWRDCGDWLEGIDLHNLGYFWEAHERWEGLWHALGREGRLADLLKALIQTAAAHIKVLEGNRRGIELLSGKSGAMLRELDRGESVLGLQLSVWLERRDRFFARALDPEELDLESFPFLVPEFAS